MLEWRGIEWGDEMLDRGTRCSNRGRDVQMLKGHQMSMEVRYYDLIVGRLSEGRRLMRQTGGLK